MTNREQQMDQAANQVDDNFGVVKALGERMRLRFDANGLIPCITQDATSLEVLMFAFMNEESLTLTLRLGVMHYYSRSRHRLWKKGETSGHLQHVVSLRVDCDQDVILARVKQVGAACHTGFRSCFFREWNGVPVSTLSEAGLLQIEASPVIDPSKVYTS